MRALVRLLATGTGRFPGILELATPYRAIPKCHEPQNMAFPTLRACSSVLTFTLYLAE